MAFLSMAGKTGCVDFTVDTVVKFSLFASCLDLWGNACFEFNPPHTTIVRARDSLTHLELSRVHAREYLTLLALAQTTSGQTTTATRKGVKYAELPIPFRDV